ncbi:hypothetical protein KEM55_007161 [Ascosphaera atra]|nr:hypothetical protein KEM55_007161 [Ascosphaera atra]
MASITRDFDCPLCRLSFNTRKELVKHKTNSPRHEYCKRCDEDFETEEYLLVHKILSPRHIACHICGLDYKSESGKDAHVRQMHRADQEITCTGCQAKFSRAAALISHVELGKCRVISAEKYQEARQKKDVWKQAFERSLSEKAKAGEGGGLLLDLEGTMASMALEDGSSQKGTEQKSGADAAPSTSGDESSRSGVHTGGVSLLGAGHGFGPAKPKQPKQVLDLITGDDEDEDIGIEAALPVQSAASISQSSSSNAAEVPEKWPTLGSGNDVSKGQSGVPSSANSPWAKGAPNIGSPQSRPAAAAPSQQNNRTSFANIAKAGNGTKANNYTSRRPGQAPGKTRPALLDLGGEENGTPSWPTSRKGAANTNTTWDDHSVSGPPPQTVVSSAAVPSKALGVWDPKHFWDDLEEQYVCACSKSFRDLKAFEAHIRGPEHSSGNFRCPGCLRLFKSITALIAHCESASVRCSVNKSQNFSRIMADISAGLLDTDGFNADGSVRYKAKEVDLDRVQW